MDGYIEKPIEAVRMFSLLERPRHAIPCAVGAGDASLERRAGPGGPAQGPGGTPGVCQ